MSRDDDDLDFLKLQEAINQMEEDMKGWCPSSGENVGRMIETPGSDEWYIECRRAAQNGPAGAPC